MKKILLASLLLFITGYSFSQTPELWGMTAQGGIQDYGVIFKINGDGTGYYKVHDFGVKNVGAAPSIQFQSNNVNFLKPTNYGTRGVGSLWPPPEYLSELWSYHYRVQDELELSRLEEAGPLILSWERDQDIAVFQGLLYG